MELQKMQQGTALEEASEEDAGATSPGMLVRASSSPKKLIKCFHTLACLRMSRVLATKMPLQAGK